jgi:hypothetical protein
MATIEKIPDSYLTPARVLPEQELADAHIENPKALRLLTYGSREIKQASPPHDHAQDGGDTLIWFPILNAIFGASRVPLAQGIVISGAQFDVSQGARLLSTMSVFVPGGVNELQGFLTLDLDSISEINLWVTLRPYSAANKNLQRGLYIAQQILFTPAVAPVVISQDVLFSNLAQLGDSRYDREFEIVIWQAYQPPAPVTSGHRIVSLYLDAGIPATVQAGGRDVSRNDLPLKTVSYADIKSGAILAVDLSLKMRATNNDLLSGMLGRATGLLSNDTPDRDRPYIQPIWCAHQHQGIDVPDSCGGFWSDGAVVKSHLISSSYFGAGLIVTTNQAYSGLLLHTNGLPDASWLLLEHRLSIPSGLGALELRFELSTGGALVNQRVFVHIDVRDPSGTSICTGLSSGVHDQQRARDAEGLWVCEVDPLDNDRFVFMRRRRLASKGLWTLDAQRDHDEIVNDELARTTHQISDVVQIKLTHPKYRQTDEPHVTQDYTLTLRLEHVIVGGATPLEPTTRINWLLVKPRRGF